MLICSACSAIHTISCSLLNKAHSWAEVISTCYRTVFPFFIKSKSMLGSRYPQNCTWLQCQCKSVKAPFLYIYTLEKWSKNINGCQTQFLAEGTTSGKHLSTEIPWLKKHWCHSVHSQHVMLVNDWVTHHTVIKQQQWAKKTNRAALR